MTSYYNYISDKLNLDMKNSEFYEDERGITPPSFYYEGTVNSFEKDPLSVWNRTYKSKVNFTHYYKFYSNVLEEH